MKTYVIIPAFNENKRIVDILKKTKRYINKKNIIVVDDGSVDKTFETIKKEGILVLRQIVNLGKGAALKTGCDYAIKKGAKILIVIDGDGQHEPKEIPNFLKALKGKDIVFSYRKFHKKMPYIFRFGNYFINKTTKFLYSINLKDTQCGYRAFTSSTYKKIRWNAQDYSMESEMITKAGKNHLKYTEIPIKTIYSEKHKGTTIFDGIKVVLNLIMWRLIK